MTIHRQIIRFVDVSKEYPAQQGSILAVRNLNLCVYPSELLSVIGPSGCGKTTLLNLLAGLDVPSSGRIEFRELEQLHSSHQIGYVFQEPALLPWRTVRQNVALPLEISGAPFEGRSVEEALRAVNILEFGDEYPGSLSLGMRQKVAIARALVQDPAVLLMDEPFSSLDSMTRQQMNFQLLDVWERMKKTVVFVTHSISEAILLSDRICLMTGRPGTVARELQVGLARPRSERTLQDPDFARLAATLYREFGTLCDNLDLRS